MHRLCIYDVKFYVLLYYFPDFDGDWQHLMFLAKSFCLHPDLHLNWDWNLSEITHKNTSLPFLMGCKIIKYSFGYIYYQFHPENPEIRKKFLLGPDKGQDLPLI